MNGWTYDLLAFETPKFVVKVLKNILFEASIIDLKESATVDKSSFAVLSSKADIASWVASNNFLENEYEYETVIIFYKKSNNFFKISSNLLFENIFLDF